MKNKQKIYCSLDIETSGFDPLKNEILEVGFVLFKIENHKISILEEWTQVFKATKEVPPQILALTGITKKELEAAPSFKDYHAQLQEKLGEVDIVGHNVIFDVKFLEGYGIKFKGEIIDTLDLVQFILPTRHSYNLENLMHYFGVAHKEAHRALADSKATLKVLEKLLGVFQSFPKALREQIAEIARETGFCWKEFLSVQVKPLKTPAKEKKEPTARLNLKNFKPEKNTIYNFPLGSRYLEELAASLGKQKKKSLLVVPSLAKVMSLWKKGLVKPFWPEEVIFNEGKLKSFAKRKTLSLEEVKFLLKALVWEKTNWQKETILDMNTSFFGGQFKELISGKRLKEDSAKVLCLDQKTFLENSGKKFFKDRQIIISGLKELEEQISTNISTKISWGYIIYFLKRIYNPEINYGDFKLKQEIVEALGATDLFFGLAHALLAKKQQGFVQVEISEAIKNSIDYNRIEKAANNYAEKLLGLNKKINQAFILEFASSLRDFFKEEENRVKWVELSENRCTFNNSPIAINNLLFEKIKSFKFLSFADVLPHGKLIEYFARRLGLGNFNEKAFTFKQKDLFSEKDIKVKLEIKEVNITDEQLLKIINKKKFPTATLLSNSLRIKEFYNNNFQDLKSVASVLVQNSTGGSNKLFRNFRINKNSLLIATERFVLKYLLNTNQNGQLIESLPVKILVLTHLPFEQFKHPYFKAVSEQFENSFEDFSLPLALYNFHKILSFFLQEDLKKIYVFDSKLSKPYAKIFKEYLGKLF